MVNSRIIGSEATRMVIAFGYLKNSRLQIVTPDSRDPQSEAGQIRYNMWIFANGIE